MRLVNLERMRRAVEAQKLADMAAMRRVKAELQSLYDKAEACRSEARLSPTADNVAEMRLVARWQQHEESVARSVLREAEALEKTAEDLLKKLAHSAGREQAVNGLITRAQRAERKMQMRRADDQGPPRRA